MREAEHGKLFQMRGRHSLSYISPSKQVSKPRFFVNPTSLLDYEIPTSGWSSGPINETRIPPRLRSIKHSLRGVRMDHTAKVSRT